MITMIMFSSAEQTALPLQILAEVHTLLLMDVKYS